MEAGSGGAMGISLSMTPEDAVSTNLPPEVITCPYVLTRGRFDVRPTYTTVFEGSVTDLTAWPAPDATTLLPMDLHAVCSKPPAPDPDSWFWRGTGRRVPHPTVQGVYWTFC